MNVYADTSVIGGCFDQEFNEWSVALFQEFLAGTKQIMLSDLTLQELEHATEEVREMVKKIPSEHIIGVGISDEAILLAESYISEGA